MPLIKFVRNYRDLSTDHGFQFEFFCDICRNGYQSTFLSSKTGLAAEVLGAADSVLGGIFRSARTVGEKVHSAKWEKDHDQAFNQAIQEVKVHFVQCHRCGKWVCKEICWNEERGLCVECAPKLAAEIAAAQTEAAIEQIREKVREQDLTRDLDLGTGVVAICPACGAETKGAKFCPECGVALKKTNQCPRCGTDAGEAKFCPECGQKLT